jgi:thiamine-phosphate pyrophosphorylase
MKGFYFITDSTLSLAGNVSDVKNAVMEGVLFFQYRAKNLSDRAMYEEAHLLRSLCLGRKFLVNDRVDIALAVCADGVHLGQDDLSCKAARKILGKDKIIGITVHNMKQAKDAVLSGADYLAIAPVFATNTKKNASRPCGVGLIKKIKTNLPLPVVAIGGITLENASSVIKAGASAVCAISAVVPRVDIRAQIRRFQRLFT